VHRLALLLIAVGLGGCADEAFEFVCESDVQCDDGGGGLCVRKWCSYPDADCESGYRFAADADAELAESCVPPEDLPAE